MSHAREGRKKNTIGVYQERKAKPKRNRFAHPAAAGSGESGGVTDGGDWHKRFGSERRQRRKRRQQSHRNAVGSADGDRRDVATTVGTVLKRAREYQYVDCKKMHE